MRLILGQRSYQSQIRAVVYFRHASATIMRHTSRNGVYRGGVPESLVKCMYVFKTIQALFFDTVWDAADGPMKVLNLHLIAHCDTEKNNWLV